MTRKLFIAGNWKMNTSSGSAVELASGVARELTGVEAVDLMTKKKVTVNDGPMSRMLEPDDLFSAIMYQVNDVWLVDSTVVNFDSDQEKKVLAEVKKRAKDAERDPKKEADYLAANPFIFHELVQELAKDFAS